MELEAFNIEFDYIKGSNNVLADTMSRLVDINLDTQQHPEGPRYEFGYAVFEEFPVVKANTEVNEVIVGTQKEIKNNPDLQDTLQFIENPIAPEIKETTRPRCQHSISKAQAETQQAGLRILQSGRTRTPHKEGGGWRSRISCYLSTICVSISGTPSSP